MTIKMKQIERILEKAEKIIDGVPIFASDRDKIAMLNRKFRLDIEIDKMEKEIKDMEEEMIKRTEEITKVYKETASQKLKSKIGGDMNYIG